MDSVADHPTGREETGFFIPAFLRQNIDAYFGAEGEQWLDRLPEHIARLEQEWGFAAERALDHRGAVSWVAPVRLHTGGSAILKTGMPHNEARFEAQALSFWSGQGVVRLLRASDDGFSLLLERCIPGTDLWSLPEREADAAAANILNRLWREPPSDAPFDTLTQRIDEWCEMIPSLAMSVHNDLALVERALELGRELAATQSRKVVLHSDFHPGNVLAAEREDWLVIDPKPLIGEPAFDIAQWLFNRHETIAASENAESLMREQVEFFADRLQLSPARIAGWAFAKAVGWECGYDVSLLFEKISADMAE